mmetsp:Transcript_21095/g.67390  ORF Transcript_21095/g.67390 Transcript_21095/m.67390 type:complete len:241 (+) Transcript_21095:251-973(+)
MARLATDTASPLAPQITTAAVPPPPPHALARSGCSRGAASNAAASLSTASTASPAITAASATDWRAARLAPAGTVRTAWVGSAAESSSCAAEAAAERRSFASTSSGATIVSTSRMRFLSVLDPFLAAAARRRRTSFSERSWERAKRARPAVKPPSSLSGASGQAEKASSVESHRAPSREEYERPSSRVGRSSVCCGRRLHSAAAASPSSTLPGRMKHAAARRLLQSQPAEAALSVAGAFA